MGCPVGRRCAPEWDRVGCFIFPLLNFVGRLSVVAGGGSEGSQPWEDCTLLALFYKSEVQLEWAPARHEETDRGEVQARKETTACGIIHPPPTEESPLLQRDSQLTRCCFENIILWEPCKSRPSNDSFLPEAHIPSRQTKLKIYFFFFFARKKSVWLTFSLAIFLYLEQWFSKRGPEAGTLTWELVRNTNSSSPAHPLELLINQTLKGETSSPESNKPSR